MDPLRLFVVDDSAVARTVLRRLHGSDGVEIVGEAHSGAAAVTRLANVEVDLVVMDVLMPGMDGLAVTEALMSTRARPVVVMSELVGRDVSLGFRALAAGALEVMPKPTAVDLADPARRSALVRRLRMLAGVPVVTRRRKRGSLGAVAPPTSLPSEGGANAPAARAGQAADLVCIGASTGGPPALLHVLSSLRAPPSCPIVIVQHMSHGFIGGLAGWLSSELGWPVQLAQDGTAVSAGRAYLAPDGCHLALRRRQLALRPRTDPSGYCPSVDALFTSVARQPVASATLAVLLTGMGRDGAEGLAALREAGAWTLAQDEASSVVYGMPRAAAERSAACEVLGLDQIAHRVTAACRG